MKVSVVPKSIQVGVRTQSMLRGSLKQKQGCPRKGLEVDVVRKSTTTNSSDLDSTTVASTGTLDESFIADGNDVDLVGLLQQEFSPMTTREECQRFWEAHQDGSSATADEAARQQEDTDQDNLVQVRDHLTQFVQWRKMYGMPTSTTCTSVDMSLEQDRQDWKDAFDLMWDQYATGRPLWPASHYKQQHQDKPKKVYHRTHIPQYFFCYQSQEDRNEIMVQLLPARIEAYSATPEQHSLAVQIYFDKRFHRFNPHQKATLCLDCRASQGWANLTVFQLQPIIAAATHDMVRYHPGRLNRLVIFPVPRLAVSLFEMIKTILPPIVAQRTQLVAGSERNCNLPKMAEKGGLPLELLQDMEQNRQHEAAKTAKKK